jgi:hypothetical protein
VQLGQNVGGRERVVDEGFAALADLPLVGGVGRSVSAGYELLIGLRVIGSDLSEQGGYRHLRDGYCLRIRLFAIISIDRF